MRDVKNPLGFPFNNHVKNLSSDNSKSVKLRFLREVSESHTSPHTLSQTTGLASERIGWDERTKSLKPPLMLHPHKDSRWVFTVATSEFPQLDTTFSIKRMGKKCENHIKSNTKNLLVSSLFISMTCKNEHRSINRQKRIECYHG